MKVYNITCECGHDHDYSTLREAKSEAKKHLSHNPDGKVFIDEVLPDMDSEGNYQTGKSHIIIKKNPAAVYLGRKGGSVTSKEKALAARENGKKGGRPKSDNK